MKVISTGKRFELYGDNLKTYDSLPAKVYTVRFSKMSGFFLEEHAEFVVKEEKIYGVHMEKVHKVLHAFDNFNRNLGVILSGEKGIGKSLFANILGAEATKKNIPVVIVEDYVPGVAAYIESIEQEIMVLFDEFDKTFSMGKDQDQNPQTSLLSLLDGTSQGKKLFVITCNQIYKLNDYLINRPGRFHYHFRFDYPNSAEITEYLKDKLAPEYHNEIKNVVQFAGKVKLNFDCLRAIAFELNLGCTFSEAIHDLNIMRMDTEYYTVSVHYTDGTVLTSTDTPIDFFDQEKENTIWFREGKYAWATGVRFFVRDCVFDEEHGCFAFTNDCFEVVYSSDEDEKEDVAVLKNKQAVAVIVRPKASKQYRYAV